MAATSTLREHLHFEENRFSVEVPLLDQYILSPRLETNFLPQHYASLYEMIGDAMAQSVGEAQLMQIDRIVALGGRNAALDGTAGSNNVNAFGLPENNDWTAPEAGWAVWVLGLSGTDTIAGSGSADLLDGGAGNDRLSGRGGNDVLMGQAGHDGLSGGAGSDRLIGGSGDDVLTGGTGADLFSFRSAFGSDQVTDFQDGLDRIDLTFLREINGGALVTMADLLVKNAKSGATIQLDLDGDRRADVLDLDGDGQVDSVSILLSSISARSVEAGDFLF